MTHVLSRLLVVGDTICLRSGREYRVDNVRVMYSMSRSYVENHPEAESLTVDISAGQGAFRANFLETPFADSWNNNRGVMDYRRLVTGSDSRHDILAIAKTSEDDSANARILFAKDLVPDEFKRIQEEAFRFLPPSARTTTVPAPPPLPPVLPAALPPGWFVSFEGLSHQEGQIFREQLIQLQTRLSRNTSTSS